MAEEINALELLKEEMQTEEIHLKVNAIHRLKVVVLCLGQEATTNQLIPYLDSKLTTNPLTSIFQNLSTQKTMKCSSPSLKNSEKSGHSTTTSASTFSSSPNWPRATRLSSVSKAPAHSLTSHSICRTTKCRAPSFRW